MARIVTQAHRRFVGPNFRLRGTLRRTAIALAKAVSSAGMSLTALVAMLLSQSSSAQAPATAWPQFRGSAPLTGVSAAQIPASLKVQWTYEAGDAIESSAAIADGTVYVTVASGELVALGLDRGQVKWKYKVELGFGESSPAVAGGKVIVGDLGGVVHAVNVADGKAAWTFKTRSEVKSSPVVVGDVVLIGSYDGSLYGLGLADGKPRWEVRTNNYVHGTPAVLDGVAYFAGCDETFRAVRASDGKVVFEAPIGAYTGASVALDAGTAYFGTFDNEVLALDLKTHRFKWRYKHPEREFPFYSSAAIASGKVIVGGRDKMIHAIDAVSGKAVWTYMTRARVESSPAVAGSRVYIGSGDGRFYVFELATGAKLWEYDMGGPLSASPAVAGGRVVIGSQDGRLVCFG